ncbi:MAG: hypothetical protein R3A52_17720 [Polyangiales bacterium]
MVDRRRGPRRGRRHRVATARARVFEPIALVGAAMEVGAEASSEDLLSAFSKALALEAAPDLGPNLQPSPPTRSPASRRRPR